MSRLAERRALVTGGASGIGAEIARLFAAEGAAVAVLDLNLAGAQRVAEGIGGMALACDVSIPTEIERAVGLAADGLGGLDVLINSAGVLVRQAFESIDAAAWQRLFEINLRGPAEVIRSALPALRAGREPAIVNVASLTALRPSLGTSAYAATKGGLLMLTKCLAQELAPIRVNAICPGIVDTPMTTEFMTDPATRQRIENGNVLHLTAKPSDIAAAAIYLASTESRLVTGTQIVIDGGSSFA